MADVAEHTPLLTRAEDIKDPYDRFSTSRKRGIVALVSWAGFVPMFVSGSFIPAIPRVARDLGSEGSVISLAVSLSIFANACGALVWATYSGYYGRRPIYLCALPLLALGSLGTASAQSVVQLMACRVIQGLGSSAGMSTGAAVVGDIYKLEERGTAMGIFFGASLVGPAIAPFLGGLFTHYLSWRAMQASIALGALLSAFLVFTFMPETAIPGTRGCDRAAAERVKLGLSPEEKKWGIVWVNPYKSVRLLRSPNLMAVTIAGTLALFTDFVISLPIAYTYGKYYNLTNEAAIGALFVPIGIGNVVGAPLAGKLSDMAVHRRRLARGGRWVPEDRLRVGVLGAATLVPLSVLVCGLLTRYVPGKLGLGLNVVSLFANGIGVDMVLSPGGAYQVDVLHAQSAEIMAASSGLRSLVLALATTGVVPAVEKLGLVPTNAIAAGLAWAGCGLLILTVRYGDQMRAWVDVGYSNAEENE